MAGKTERESVRLHVPHYQKAEWENHADELEMGLSEYVRSMVQSGRTAFEDVGTGDTAGVGQAGTDGPGTDRTRYPADSPDTIEEILLGTLDDAEYLTWEEIREETIGDIESDLEATLQDLMDRDLVVHTPRNGGYRRVE